MKVRAEQRLFWFLKPDQELDLENPGHLDMYVQQVLSHGRDEDVRLLLKRLPRGVFQESFEKVKRFLPKEVRIFWEEGLGSAGENSEGSPHSS